MAAPRRKVRVVVGLGLLAGALTLSGIACSGQSTQRPPTLVIGHVGNQPGQFSRPRAVVLTSNGDLVVIDRSGRVQNFDVRTGELGARWWLPEFANGTPTGMTVDPRDNTLWVADTHYQRILRFDLAGTIVTSFGKHGTDPGEMVFPTDVAPDPIDGTLWICEYGLRSRIMQFTPDGTFIKEWGSGEYEYAALQRPMAICVDERGILVADAGNHRIIEYDREGNVVREIGTPGTAPGQLRYPYDLAVGPDGTLYVCEYGNSRVSVFDREGVFLGTWGLPGHRPGELFSPWGIAVSPDGTLVIADTNNGRVQVVQNPKRAMRRESAL